MPWAWYWFWYVNNTSLAGYRYLLFIICGLFICVLTWLLHRWSFGMETSKSKFVDQFVSVRTRTMSMEEYIPFQQKCNYCNLGNAFVSNSKTTSNPLEENADLPIYPRDEDVPCSPVFQVQNFTKSIMNQLLICVFMSFQWHLLTPRYFLHVCIWKYVLYTHRSQIVPPFIYTYVYIYESFINMCIYIVSIILLTHRFFYKYVYENTYYVYIDPTSFPPEALLDTVLVHSKIFLFCVSFLNPTIFWWLQCA